MRRLLIVCILFVLGACTARNEVVDNTYPLLGKYDVVVSYDYDYVGELRSFWTVTRAGQTMPSWKRPIDSCVFVSKETPRRFVVIERWRTDGSWVTPKGGIIKIDGVDFHGWVWRRCSINEDSLKFMSDHGYDFSEVEFCKYRLAKLVNRSVGYSIHVFVEKGELESDDWSDVKPYLRGIVKDSILVVQR